MVLSVLNDTLARFNIVLYTKVETSKFQLRLPNSKIEAEKTSKEVKPKASIILRVREVIFMIVVGTAIVTIAILILIAMGLVF